MASKGKSVMMVGYALVHPSGTCHFYNSEKDSTVTSNSVRWSDFWPWVVKSEDMLIGALHEKSSDTEIVTVKENKT